MNLVLDEEVYQGYQSAKKCSRQVFSVFDRSRIVRTKGETPKSPWEGSNEVRDHKDIMPIVVVGGSDICPASACNCPKKTGVCDELGEARVWTRREEVP